MPKTDRTALTIARRMARELIDAGAIAVALTGSHARGEAHAGSDIDLIALYPRSLGDAERPTPIMMRNGRLVTVAWETAAAVRATFGSPRLAPTFVPGWRHAVLLQDPRGVAARLQRRARAWRWDDIATAADGYVAREIAGLAEEVHKLTRALAVSATLDAAVQRSVLALGLAGVMAVQCRMLYETENDMWDIVAAAMGAEWTSAQRAALSTNGETLDASCRAALRLYALAAAEARPLLDRRQRAVVDDAVALCHRAV